MCKDQNMPDVSPLWSLCCVGLKIATYCLQAVQKLQEKVTKVEAHSTEALRAVQAESARATQVEAARYAQTEAVMDSLLAFKQTQSAELAKRDNAIASLHGLVTQLQVQLQRQQLSESAAQAQLQRDESTERQTSGAERQVPAAKRPQSASSRNLSTLDAMTPGQAEQNLAHLAATSQQGQKASRGSLKGRVSLSIDRKKDLQRAAGKAAVRLGGQKPAGVRRSLVAGDTSVPEQLHRRPLSEVPLGELSGSLGSVAQPETAAGAQASFCTVVPESTAVLHDNAIVTPALPMLQAVLPVFSEQTQLV